MINSIQYEQGTAGTSKHCLPREDIKYKPSSKRKLIQYGMFDFKMQMCKTIKEKVEHSNWNHELIHSKSEDNLIE